MDSNTPQPMYTITKACGKKLSHDHMIPKRLVKDGKLTVDIFVTPEDGSTENVPAGSTVVITGDFIEIKCGTAGGRRKKRRSTKHRRNRRSKATRKN